MRRKNGARAATLPEPAPTSAEPEHAEAPATKRKRKVLMTPAWVDAVKPEAAPVDWSDSGQRGLVLRVERSGVKVWWARYTMAGKDRRFKIGGADALTLKAARTSARGKLVLAESGTDPQIERERLRAGQGVATVVEAWLEDSKLGPGSKWKGGLEGGSGRSFLPHVRRFVRDLGARKVVEITSKDVERFVMEAEAPATRNRALTALRGFFWWCGRKHIVQTDPTAGLGKEREAERTRTLSDLELRALVHGFDGTRYGRAVRLLALTGLRRDEVLGAAWSWYDAEGKTLTIPPDAEKTGRSRGEARRVALSSQACDLMADQRERLMAEGLRSSPWVFSTLTGGRPHSDALKPILYGLRGRRTNGQEASEHKKAKPRPAVLVADSTGSLGTIHDLRRTVADALLNRLAAAPWVVDHVVLGHVRPKLLRTYMPVLPLDEARAALGRWADLLDSILAASPAAETEASGQA